MRSLSILLLLFVGLSAIITSLVLKHLSANNIRSHQPELTQNVPDTKWVKVTHKWLDRKWVRKVIQDLGSRLVKLSSSFKITVGLFTLDFRRTGEWRHFSSK